VNLVDDGLIDVGAGGGESTAGGGSGGLVIIEAPVVSFNGATTGVVANRGAGGGCGLSGPDATTSANQAIAPTCPTYFAGNGGTGTLNAGRGCEIQVDDCTGVCPIAYGGGGGSAGRMRVVTKDGSFQSVGGPVVSAGLSVGMLTPQ
jgi:hypothetical protein